MSDQKTRAIIDEVIEAKIKLEAENARLTNLMEMQALTYKAEISKLKERERGYRDIFSWLMGANGDFPARRIGSGAYWWRSYLRTRLEAFEKGELCYCVSGLGQPHQKHLSSEDK